MAFFKARPCLMTSRHCNGSDRLQGQKPVWRKTCLCFYVSQNMQSCTVYKSRGRDPAHTGDRFLSAQCFAAVSSCERVHGFVRLGKQTSIVSWYMYEITLVHRSVSLTSVTLQRSFDSPPLYIYSIPPLYSGSILRKPYIYKPSRHKHEYTSEPQAETCHEDQKSRS